ncbi:response regulator transcription factor [Metabacillus herbersteinensis]|uniref:Response regulator transcription factor n=1 Tax=Metabacillus herbersteinensis TaxID=283816 RepID=A0ABV6GA65_9BACI
MGNLGVYEYMKEVSKIQDGLMKAEMMIRGCVQFFPFQRASIFAYSPLNHIGEGIFQIEKDRLLPMQWIKEDVRLIPAVHQAVTINQPQYLDMTKSKGLFPEKYIQRFELTSLVIIPISQLNNVFGCVFIDRYTGKHPFNKNEINRLSDYFQIILDSPNSEKTPTHKLSKREIEALQFLANGYSLKEMASTMKISEFTVRDYLSSVVRKLAVKHRSEAVAVGLRRGIIR